MSRAFVKEDAHRPDLELAAFQAFRATERDEFEGKLAHQDDDLIALLRWARARPSGQFQIRDRQGVLLALVS